MTSCKKCYTERTGEYAKQRRQEKPHEVSARDKRYRRTPKNQAYVKTRRDIIRERRLVNTYGLDLKGYNSMLAAQQGRCAICNEEAVLVVDHDHQTGVTRKLLCVNCNIALGHLKDDVERVMSAAAYLIEHQPLFSNLTKG